MYKKITLAFLVLFFILSCNQSGEVQISNSLLKESLSIEDASSRKINIDSISYFIKELDSSNDSLAFIWLNKKYKTELYEYDGYAGVVPQGVEESSMSNYFCYRYNEYVADLDNDRLYYTLIGNTHLYHFKKDPNDSIISELKAIEEKYLSFYLAKDSSQKHKYIDIIKSNLEIYPTSKRLKYLYANMNFEVKQFNTSIPIYKELLKRDYYSYNILRRLIEYYQIANIDSCQKYLSFLEQKFPGRCIVGNLDSKDDSLFMASCYNCLAGRNRRDSIRARVALTRYYLNNKDFDKVEKQYEGFSKSNQEFMLDSLKIWEAGEYYDIKLESLFLKKDYTKFCSFLFKEVGYNTKIKVESNAEFYNLIKGYFLKYEKDKSLNDFDVFFNKNFFPITKGKLSVFT